MRIASVTLVVQDYDEAITFFVEKLGFELIEDTALSDENRWVLVRPRDSDGPSMLLAKAVNDEQVSRIGNQTGGRVAFFLHTDDFNRDFQELKSRSVQFVREPVTEPYGRVAVFVDLYGNKWDLIQPNVI